MVVFFGLAISALASFPFSFWRSSSGSSGFTSPTSITGLKLWLQADSLALSDGTAVSSWSDSSGQANTATQATGANQPIFKTAIINGKPVLRFNGTSSYLTLTANPGTSITTTFVVAIINVAPASLTAYAPFIICGSTLGQPRIDARNGGTNWGFWADSDYNAGENLVSGAPNILELTTTAGASVLYRNGTQKATTTAQPSSGGAIIRTIGAETSFSRYLNGDIAEVIVYNSVLSSADRLSVERYLGSKYGITVP